MRLRHIAAGAMATVSLGGLALVASGFVEWGVRAVALFALVGLLWLLSVVVWIAGDLHGLIDYRYQRVIKAMDELL